LVVVVLLARRSTIYWLFGTFFLFFSHVSQSAVALAPTGVAPAYAKMPLAPPAKVPLSLDEADPLTAATRPKSQRKAQGAPTPQAELANKVRCVRLLGGQSVLSFFALSSDSLTSRLFVFCLLIFPCPRSS